jgi:two-component system, LytTR family, sensor kinase
MFYNVAKTMFAHRYRYFFIAALAVYTYVNTILCEVYTYFKIDIEWYYAFATIALVTLFIWEASRLLEPLFIKHLNSAGNKIKIQVFFFAAGTFATTLLTTGIVFLISINIPLAKH